MKDTNDMTDEELTELCFGIPKNADSVIEESKKRKIIAQTDKYYLNFPWEEEFEDGTIDIRYPYEGWTEEEIKEVLNIKNK